MKKYFKLLMRFKYLFILIGFSIWIIFFDQNRILNHIKLQKTLNGLQSQKDFYEKEIRRYQKLSNDLTTDSAFLEKYAREKYLLKRENEVIYLIVDE